MKVKQIIAMIVVVALLMTGSVLVTMAYLTASDEVINVFTVGNIRMILDEAAVDENGQAIEGAVRERNGNTYHLVPGGKYDKDPTLTVEGNSDDCYVRMMVTVSNYDALKRAFPRTSYPEYYADFPVKDGDSVEMVELFLLDGLVDGYDASEWACVGFTRGEGTTGTYEFRYKEMVARQTNAQPLAPLFTHVVVPNTISTEALQNLAAMEIKVVAHAMQASGFNGDVDAAWTAFDGQQNG